MAVSLSQLILMFSIVINSSSIASVKSQSVLTWDVTAYGSTKTFKFSKDKYLEFYGHLCNNSTQSVKIHRNSNNLVITISKYPQSERLSESNAHSQRYACTEGREMNRYGRYIYYLFCERSSVLDIVCLGTLRCWSYRADLTATGSCDLESVEITWDSNQNVYEIGRNKDIVNRGVCEAGCNPSTTSSLSSTTQKTFTGAATTGSVTPSATQSNGSSGHGNSLVEDNDGRDASGVIIGVVVSLVVVTAVLAVLGVLYWRRRRKAATSTKSNKNSSTANTPYSVALHNDCTDDNQIKYPYATIEPSDAVAPSSTEDPGYYNQAALASTRSPQTLVVGDRSKMPVHDSPEYYNFNNGQSGSTDANTTAVTSSLNGVARSNDLGNGYSTAVHTSSDGDGTFYYSGANGSTNNDNTALISTTPNTTNHGGNIGNTEYSFANPVISDTKNEYSKLHDPVRNIKDPYNVLAAADDKGNQKTTAAPSSSTVQAPTTYSLAQPILKKTKPPVEVIDVGPSSKLPNNVGNPQTSSEHYIRNDHAGNKVKPEHRKKDKANFLVADSKDGAASAPGGRRNEYFELESNYDSDASETDGKEISDPYSEIDGAKDGAVNPYDEYTI